MMLIAVLQMDVDGKDAVEVESKERKKRRKQFSKKNIELVKKSFENRGEL